LSRLDFAGKPAKSWRIGCADYVPPPPLGARAFPTAAEMENILTKVGFFVIF
jgi:hypothetical protein